MGVEIVDSDEHCAWSSRGTFLGSWRSATWGKDASREFFYQSPTGIMGLEAERGGRLRVGFHRVQGPKCTPFGPHQKGEITRGDVFEGVKGHWGWWVGPNRGGMPLWRSLGKGLEARERVEEGWIPFSQ